MKVLIACEFSGVVRDAFIKQGHDAWSCDLLPSDKPGPHYQGCIIDFLAAKPEWDLLIAHPPCTYLCSSGIHWNAKKPERQRLTLEALDFFNVLLSCSHIPKRAIENPIGVASTLIRKPDQYIQPYEYGHPESKRTCLWLEGLPPLEPTNVLPLPETGRWDNQTASGQNNLGPSPDRWKLRSLTYPGIAEAMATQWGALHL